MVHIRPDFKTKKSFLEAYKQGVKIYVFDPAGIFPLRCCQWGIIEAPAERHKWYLSVRWDENYKIVSVTS
jgi:hypothetical protein